MREIGEQERSMSASNTINPQSAVLDHATVARTQQQ